MKKLYHIIVSFVCLMVFSLSLAGCGIFTSPMERPIIEDHAKSKEITTFATIPSRRMVIINPEHIKDGKETNSVFVCAEPSPDVSDNLASSLAATLTGKGFLGGNASSEASVNISKALATTAQFLFKRTQGVQLYRDGMYNLCQARMNGIIDNDAFILKADALLKVSVELVKQEIPNLYPVQQAAAGNTAGNTTVTAATGNATTATATTGGTTATVTIEPPNQPQK